MENSKKNSAISIVLVAIVTLVLGIILGGGGFYVYNSSVENKDVETNQTEDKQDTTTQEPDQEAPSNDEVVNTEKKGVGKVEFYSGDKYTLTLVTHYDVETVTAKNKGVSDVNSFILSINEYYSGRDATGTYYYEGDKIVLLFTGGCGAESAFNCTLPEGASIVNYNQLKLTYSDDTINLGNIKLVKDK